MWKNRSLGRKDFLVPGSPKSNWLRSVTYTLVRASTAYFELDAYRLKMGAVAEWSPSIYRMARTKTLEGTLPWSHFPSHVMILHVILCCPFPSLNWNDLKDISIESGFEFSVSNLKSTIWFPTSLVSTGNESRTLIYGFHCFAIAFLLILEKVNFEKYR